MSKFFFLISLFSDPHFSNPPGLWVILDWDLGFSNNWQIQNSHKVAIWHARIWIELEGNCCQRRVRVVGMRRRNVKPHCTQPCQPTAPPCQQGGYTISSWHNTNISTKISQRIDRTQIFQQKYLNELTQHKYFNENIPTIWHNTNISTKNLNNLTQHKYFNENISTIWHNTNISTKISQWIDTTQVFQQKYINDLHFRGLL